MHGPYKEGANSTSVLIIYMLKFNGTSYVIASLATAYLIPIKLILASEKLAFPVSRVVFLDCPSDAVSKLFLATTVNGVMSQ